MTAPTLLPPPGPALLLHMAADRLRRAAQAALDRESEDGRAPDDWFADMVDGYLGGPVGLFCGLVSPAVGLDLADFLDATAVEAVKQAAAGGTEAAVTGGHLTRMAQRILGEAA